MSNENTSEELMEGVEANHVEKESSKDDVKTQENPLDNIAYFVIFPQNTKVLDEAIAIIPNEVAKKAVLDAINSVLVPVTKEQLETAQTQADAKPEVATKK
jgi:hypothetical protein